MGKPSGFLEFGPEAPTKRPAAERIRDFREFESPLGVAKLKNQAARCMDCGVPACHAYGCPLANRIPDYNDMVFRGHWKAALDLLHDTNNFPEITGRICPAPCEAACTLFIHGETVTIRQIELAAAEQGWASGWIKPEPPAVSSGRRVAVIGSGPAGLAAAQELARMGHAVVVYEKQDRIGGLLRYGIPDFKLEKRLLDRRLDQLRSEGVVFETGVAAGTDISAQYMRHHFDAVLIAVGASVPRSPGLTGQQLPGVHFAMEYLKQQNRANAGDHIPSSERITAEGLDVAVVGGGDTGSDCVGTARRQGADRIVQIELLPEPPTARAADNPWPTWPNVMRTSSSQEEGCERLWSIRTKGCTAGRHGRVQSLQCIRIVWSRAESNGRMECREIPGSEFEVKADLVLIATGFQHLEHGPLVRDFGIELDNHGHVHADRCGATSVPGVYAAGDCVLGTSLAVKAIDQGRRAATGIDAFLAGSVRGGTSQHTPGA